MNIQSLNNFSTWLTLVMLVIFSTMVAMATQYPPRAAMMPLIVGIPGIALCAIQLLIDFGTASGWFSKIKSRPQAGSELPPEAAALLAESAAEEEEPEFGAHTVRNELVMWGYFIAFIAGVLFFGFMPAIPILVGAYLFHQARTSWWVALLAAATSLGVLYFLFEIVLRFQLHRGLWTPQILAALPF